MEAEASQPVSVEDVRARAASAGLAIDPEFEDEIAFMLEGALASLRTLDSRATRQVEPAVAFDATRGIQA